jgi:RimJ/RimL family protein N-acetyltransferase
VSRQHRPIPWHARDERGEPVTLREATPDDALPYLHHMRRIVSETPFMLQCPADSLPSLGEQGHLFEQLARLDNSVSILAIRPARDVTRRVAGSLTCLGGRTRRTSHACSLGMGVDRSDWGLGIGGSLLDAALTWAARGRMLQRMSLQVFTANTKAHGLYLSRGFVEEGTLNGEVLVDGRFESLIGMAADIAGVR